MAINNNKKNYESARAARRLIEAITRLETVMEEGGYDPALFIRAERELRKAADQVPFKLKRLGVGWERMAKKTVRRIVTDHYQNRKGPKTPTDIEMTDAIYIGQTASNQLIGSLLHPHTWRRTYEENIPETHFKQKKGALYVRRVGVEEAIVQKTRAERIRRALG